MTTVCIHQPDFAPWIGFFDRLIQSDIFVVLDNVQFLRRGWHNRDKIKTAHGTMWLTVPVKKKGRYGQLIREAEIDNTRRWREEHLKSLQTWYGGAPHFDAYFPGVREIYLRNHRLLIDLNMDLLAFLMAAFDIQVEIRKASSLPVTGKRTDLLVEIVKAVGGDVYLSGLGARAYLEEEKFARAGIRVVWQEFEHPVYPQLYGEFIPNLSSLDFLFNCGEQCRAILRRQPAVVMCG
ncbi:MAG: WbqC family protein [Chloroflexi bacterium]|nr:WbqC family protein [Chloroflexota bacterium]